eukprot:scaffold26401_cov87-Skeletonema_dohrnii-CCMP3373.AAC.1
MTRHYEAGSGVDRSVADLSGGVISFPYFYSCYFYTPSFFAAITNHTSYNHDVDSAGSTTAWHNE